MAAASPAGADRPHGHDHELDNMADKKPSLPVEDDVMQLARLGEIGAIQKLFDRGACDATYTDDQGITPLHVRARPLPLPLPLLCLPPPASPAPAD